MSQREGRLHIFTQPVQDRQIVFFALLRASAALRAEESNSGHKLTR